MNNYDYILQRIEMIPIAGCWIWMKAIMSRGYGSLVINNKAWQAHRFSYSIFRGEIPLGMLVCHSCDVPACVNPSHLFLGTGRDNLIDCYKKSRRGKLTIRDVPTVTSMRSAGMTIYEIAPKFCVSHATVARFLIRENIKGIPNGNYWGFNRRPRPAEAGE